MNFISLNSLLREVETVGQGIEDDATFERTRQSFRIAALERLRNRIKSNILRPEAKSYYAIYPDNTQVLAVEWVRGRLHWRRVTHRPNVKSENYDGGWNCGHFSDTTAARRMPAINVNCLLLKTLFYLSLTRWHIVDAYRKIIIISRIVTRRSLA